MGFNLYETQESIKTYLEGIFTNYEIVRGGVPDDEALLRVDGKVKTYVVLRFRPIQKNYSGGSFMGARWDEYFSTVDVNVVSSSEERAAQALTLFVDRLIGFRPAGGTELVPEGGSGDFTVRNSQSRPSAFISSQRLRFGINVEAPSGFIPGP